MNIREQPDIARTVAKALTALGSARGNDRADILWLMVELGHAQGRIDAVDRMLTTTPPEPKP